jgi:hypothetical protein
MGATNMTGMPLAILDDSAGRGDPWRRPTFLRGTEQPVLERDENLLVRITDCDILLETRTDPGQPWEAVWRTRRPGQATVTDRRLVVGCRRFERPSGRVAVTTLLTALARTSGYHRAGRCLGGHFRYEWVSDVSIALGAAGQPARLRLVVTEPWVVSEVAALPGPRGRGEQLTAGEHSRRWRLSVGAASASGYLPDLVTLVANEVAETHRRGAGPDRDLGVEAESAAADGWPQLHPGPGGSGTVRIPGACPLGARPVGAGDRAWRA